MIIKRLFERILVRNWPRKVVALVSAIFIWLLVSETLTTTRTVSDVPVRIINVPVDKTVVGLLPNGQLNKRITLTVTGSKSTVEEISPHDLEVVLNADGHQENWIAPIDKRNVFCTNGEIDLKKQIAEISANDLFIKFSNLVTEEIPITIAKPIGEPPKEYQFLDIWPKYLNQKVRGPEEQVLALKEKGLELTFNLNSITQEELDSLHSKQKGHDEVSFKIPDSWKTLTIPFKEVGVEPLNDPRAKLLRIDFLKQELVPLSVDLPITLFFPLKYSLSMNPQAFSLMPNDIVHRKNGLNLLTMPLYVRDVSRLFLDTVKGNLLLIIVAAPKGSYETLHWTVEFIDEKALEETFVKLSLKQAEESFTKYNEMAARYRFREYLRKLVLYTEDGEPLQLSVKLKDNIIELQQQ